MESHYNRAGRRSGGDRRLVFAKPALDNEEKQLAIAVMNLAKLSIVNDLPAREIVLGAISKGYLECSEADAERIIKLVEELNQGKAEGRS